MPMGDNDYQVDCADVPVKKNDWRHPSYWKLFNEMRAFHPGLGSNTFYQIQIQIQIRVIRFYQIQIQIQIRRLKFYQIQIQIQIWRFKYKYKYKYLNKNTICRILRAPHKHFIISLMERVEWSMQENLWRSFL